MKKLFLVLVILSFVENTMAQIKMAQLPEKEKKEVVFVYDSLTNVERHNTEKREYYYKHLAGQKITGISLSDYYPMIGLRNSDFLNATEDLKRIEGMSFRIDSVGYGYKNSRNFDRVDIFYVSEDNNPNNKLEIFSDAEYGWTQINLAWVCHGYFEKIKQLYLGKELVYINQDNEDDVQEYTHSKDRFIDYNTSRNLTKKIPCNSVWKCTDVLVLPGKLNFRDCDNRVILNLENEQYGKYYVFASELIKRRDWKNSRYFMTMEDFHKYQAVQNQLREVAKVKAAKAAAESVKRAKEHREYIIAKYGETYGSLILQGRVVIGMTKDQCIEALGHPSRINRTTTASRVSEQWVYSSRYLYFDNGVLVTIQD